MSKKIKWNLIVIFSIVIISICISPITFQNDTFYTIKVGEVIVNEGFVQPDVFTIHEDMQYTYPHWLFDVVVYLIYSFAGFIGLYIFQICVTICLGLILYYTIVNLFKKKGIAFFMSCVTLLLMKDFITVRAQLVTYIFFALEIFLLEKYFSTNNKKFLIGLPVLSALIANNHVAVWPFFFILFLPYFVSCIKINIEKMVTEKYKGFVALLIVFVICALMGFATPLGKTPFTYLLNTMQGTTTKSISEHLPIGLTTNIGLPFLIYIIVVILLVWLTNIEVSTKNLSLFGGLIILTLSSKRQLSLFLLIMAFVSSKLILDIYQKYKSEGIDVLSEKLLKFIYKFKIILIIIGLIPIIVFYGKPKLNHKFVSEAVYPTKAAKFIKENIDPENMVLFNEYNYGSYLLFEDIKVFIDSRADLYTKEFNPKEGEKDDVFSDYMNVSNQNITYEPIFTKYNVTHVILYKNSKLNLNVQRDQNYNRIYQDDYFVIYERNL